jgi:hypothetical protein
MINWQTISGILQVVLPAALSYAVAKGWVAQSAVADITAAVLTLGAAIWSAVTNQKGAK